MSTCRPAGRRSSPSLPPAPRVRTYNYKNICPAALGLERPAAGGLLAKDRVVLRADQPRLHGLRAVQGVLHRRPALCRRDVVDVPAAGREQPRQLHRLGSEHRQDRLVGSGAVLGLVGGARDSWRRGLLWHARGLPEGGRHADRQGACTGSRRRPGSSATSTHSPTTASSTSPCCRVSAAGRASAWRPG